MKTSIKNSLAALLVCSALGGAAQAEELSPIETYFIKDLVIEDVNSGLSGKDNFLNLKKYFGDFTQVSVLEIQNTYSKNELKGNKLYKDKNLFIYGVISEVGEDVTGKPFVTFKNKSLFSPRAYFVKSEIDDLSELSKGERVGAFCKVQGFIMQAVVFDDCFLAETVLQNKVLNPILKEANECLTQKCDDTKVAKRLAVLASMLNTAATEKEKEQLLSKKTNREAKEKILNALLRKIKKTPEKYFSERLKTLGYEPPVKK